MHANLHQIQDIIVSGVREWEDHHRVHPPRLEVLAVLALAEKPLTRQEIALRAGISRPDSDGFVQRLLDQGLLQPVRPGLSAEEESFEAAHDLEESVTRLAEARLAELVERLEPRLSRAQELLESCRSQFDGFDWLVAKNLRRKIRGFHRLLKLAHSRKHLLSLLGDENVKGSHLQKVSIT